MSTEPYHSFIAEVATLKAESNSNDLRWYMKIVGEEFSVKSTIIICFTDKHNLLQIISVQISVPGLIQARLTQQHKLDKILSKWNQNTC